MHNDMSHENERNRRACPIHDENLHWQDDIAYVNGDVAEPPEGYKAPTWAEMAAVILRDKPEAVDNIYRFALVYVNGETGHIDVIGDPASNFLTVVNLLSKAISMMAFQESETVKRMQETISEKIERLLGVKVPKDDDNIDLDDYPESGQYL